jgi:hypothetical protein
VESRAFYEVVVSDFHRNGMTGVQDLPGMMTGRGMFQAVTKEWGTDFSGTSPPLSEWDDPMDSQ